MNRFLLSLSLVGLASTVSACSNDDSATPFVIAMEPASQISAAMTHTCATLQNGNVGCWGKGTRGEFGKDLTGAESSASAQPLPIVEKVVSVGTGTVGSCAVLEDKTVQCWGDGRDGQLGIDMPCEAGYADCLFAPNRVPGLSDILAVVSNKGPLVQSSDTPQKQVACALDTEGLVRCWGTPGADELGRGTSATVATTPELVVDLQGFTVRDIVQITGGGQRMCALDIMGSVWCWGSADAYGQPGGQGAKRIDLPLAAKFISAGAGHACAVLTDGRVACWGRNVNGECGVSSTQNETCCNTSDTGCLFDCLIKPVFVRNIANAVGVAAGGYHTCAWLTNGMSACWGSNQALQLGDSTPTLESAPITRSLGTEKIVQMAAGRDFTCALTIDGVVRCWGSNDYGQAGQAGK